MSLMCYDAGYEKNFGEFAESARHSVELGEYDNAVSDLEAAKELTDNLWLPQTEIEKIKYIKLRESNYKTLADLYAGLVQKLKHDFETTTSDSETKEEGLTKLCETLEDLKTENEKLKKRMQYFESTGLTLEEQEGIHDLLRNV